MDRYKLNFEKNVLFTLEFPRNLYNHKEVSKVLVMINNLLKDHKASSLMLSKEDLKNLSEKYSKFSISTNDGFYLESVVTKFCVELKCSNFAYSIKEMSKTRKDICKEYKD